MVGPPLSSNGFLPAIHQGAFISDRILRVEEDFDPYELIATIRSEDIDEGDAGALRTVRGARPAAASRRSG